MAAIKHATAYIFSTSHDASVVLYPHHPGVAGRLKSLYLKQERLFPALGSVSPGWRVLLEIYIAMDEGRQVCVTRLTKSTGLPSTTSIRAVKLLLEQQLIYKEVDNFHSNRRILHLTEAGLNAVNMLLLQLVTNAT